MRELGGARGSKRVRGACAREQGVGAKGREERA